MTYALNIVVAGWKVYDVQAIKFSEYFYSELKNKNVCCAIKTARKEIFKSKQYSRGWAAYMLYGNPFLNLV